jgi:N-acetyltransferase B complex (NatB) non catalytic subunit
MAQNMKIHAIHAAIDDGNLQKAVRLCEAREMLKVPAARAIKASIFARYGSKEDALSIAYELIRTKPVDINVVEPLLQVFHFCEDVSSMSQLLENALLEKPDDVILLRQLCFCSFRLQDMKKLQQCALKLSKITNGTLTLASGNAAAEYNMWAAVSLHIQVSNQAKQSNKNSSFQLIPRGNGWGFHPVHDASQVASMRLAETLLKRSLDMLAPHQRSSELVGLYFHTLLRLDRANDILSDPYFLEVEKIATQKTALHPSVNASPWIYEEGIIPRYELAFEEDVQQPANGKGGRGLVPGPLQPVDARRHVAFYSLQSALHVEKQSSSSADTRYMSWKRVYDAFVQLFLQDSEDFAYSNGISYAIAKLYLLHSSISNALDAKDQVVFPSIKNGVFIFGDPNVNVVINSSAPLSRTRSLSRILFSSLLIQLHIESSNEKIPTDLSNFFLNELCSYIKHFGNKASTFSDLKLFLTPFLSFSDPKFLELNTKDIKFLSDDPRILAMPFLPASLHCSSSDVASYRPLFFWTYSLSLENEGLELSSLLKWSVETHFPTSKTREMLHEIAVHARDAAISQETSSKNVDVKRPSTVALKEEEIDGNNEDDDEALVGSLKQASLIGKSKKNKKAKEKKAHSSSNVSTESVLHAAGENKNDDDPHGVKEALKSASELVLSPEQTSTVSDIRDSIRRFITALQLCHYLGLKKSDPTNTMHTSTVSTKYGMSLNDLLSAWQNTLPLSLFSVGGQREVQEGDDILLISIHQLWESAFVQLDTTSEPSIERARNLFLESSLLIELGAAVSPYNASFHVAGVRVNSWLNVPGTVVRHWTELRVKHISLDSLVPTLLLPIFARLPWFDATKTICDQYNVYYNRALRDIPDYCRVALREGHLSRLVDLIRFSSRVKESVGVLLSRLVYAQLGISVACKNLNDLQGYLQKCLITGEIPEAQLCLDESVLKSSRDNDERDILYSWKSPSDVLLAEYRGMLHISDEDELLKSCFHSPLVDSLLSLSTCSIGGIIERHYRRNARESYYSFRVSLYNALYWGISGENTSVLDREVQKLKELSKRSSPLTDRLCPGVRFIDTGIASCDENLQIQCDNLLIGLLQSLADILHRNVNENSSDLLLSYTSIHAMKIFECINVDSSQIFQPSYLSNVSLVVVHTAPFVVFLYVCISKHVTSQCVTLKKNADSDSKLLQTLLSLQEACLNSLKSLLKLLTLLEKSLKARRNLFDGSPDAVRSFSLGTLNSSSSKTELISNLLSEMQSVKADSSTKVSKQTKKQVETGSSFVEASSNARKTIFTNTVSNAIQDFGASYTKALDLLVEETVSRSSLTQSLIQSLRKSSV